MIEKSIYIKRIDDTARRLKRVAGDLKIIAWGRLASFILSFLTFYFLFEVSVLIAVLSFLAFFGIFLRLIIFNAKKQRVKAYLESYRRINQDEVKFTDWQWGHFNDGRKYADNTHDYVNDLDVFGEGSLFQFINRTKTSRGEEALAYLFKNQEYDEKSIYSMQEMVQELARKIDLRHNFLATADQLTDEGRQLQQLYQWLASEEEKEIPFQKLWVRVLLSMMATGALILALAGVITFKLAILPFFINLTLVGWHLRKINAVHDKVSRVTGLLQHYKSLLARVESEPFESGVLLEIQQVLIHKHDPSSQKIHNLSRILTFFDSRLNMLAGVLMNGFLLSDFTSISRISQWKIHHAGEVPSWFRVLAQFDAWCSLGNYAFNFPGYVFPEVDTELIVDSKAQGHPLIRAQERVCNDFTISKKGEVIIVTGANMAGKSTFLRTVATNLVLAGMGLPVCAGQFKYKPLKIFTSMRTSDSLTKNESYFYAELLRLKQLLTHIKNGQDVFFILDEILKGTNSADKQKGSAAFLKQLVRLKATGIIATHDLSLGDLETAFPDVIRNLCFEIEIDGPDIRFDYKLYPGITKKMNASLLMEQMGLLE
ncbi:MAG: MutS-related protein [Bacteroidota bacterium]